MCAVDMVPPGLQGSCRLFEQPQVQNIGAQHFSPYQYLRRPGIYCCRPLHVERVSACVCVYACVCVFQASLALSLSTVTTLCTTTCTWPTWGRSGKKWKKQQWRLLNPKSDDMYCHWTYTRWIAWNTQQVSSAWITSLLLKSSLF